MLGHMRSYIVWVRWPTSWNCLRSKLLCHPIFHVSMLKKCLGDQASILPVESLGSIKTCPKRRYLLDFRQTNQADKEQEDWHSEGIVEESSCSGCYVGGLPTL